MEENKQIRIPLREDYRNGDLLRGRDVNKITHRVNELTGDIDKIDIDLSGKLDTSAYTEDKAAIESRIDGVAEGLSTKEDISAHTADMEAIRASLDNKVEVSAYTENNTRLDGRINSVVNQCTRLDISKQNKLTAGTNITIENDVISAQQPDLSPYALSADVATGLAGKEDKAPDAMLRAAMEFDDLLVDYSPINSFTSGVYRIGVKIQVGPDSDIVVGYGRVVAIDISAFVGGEAYIQYITFDAFPIEGIEMDLVVRMYRNGAWMDAVKHVRPFVDDNNDMYLPNKSTYSATKINSLLSGKQTTLTAGTNVTIQNNVISAQQPDLSPYALSADVATELSKKVNTTAYTQDKAAMQASISANTTAITQLQQSKQNNLSAGTGIQIQNDVISLSGAGGATIDDNVTGSTTCWSSQKVYDEMRITLTNLLPTGNVLAF